VLRFLGARPRILESQSLELRIDSACRCLILMIIWLTSSMVLVGPLQAADDPDEQRIDTILTRLEARSDGLTDISTDVQFVEEDQVNLTKRVKIGKVRFLMGEPNPRFMVHFERTEIDGMLGQREWFLFDGRWLYEAVERIKQVTQREIAAPGERIDLFDLENAPFPLPFGQKKETILKNFEVSIAPPKPGDPPETDHLVCIPRPETTFYRKFDRLEFLVNRQLHLATRIIAVKNEGFETITADFPGLSNESLNKGLDPGDFRPPGEWKPYKWVVEGPGPSVESPAEE
jgi:hypothetical protein